MEIESGHDRHVRPHHLPDRNRQVGFQVVNPIHHPGTMQGEHDTIKGLAVTKPHQDFLLEPVVGPRLNRPRGLGTGHQDRDRLHAELFAGRDKAVNGRLLTTPGENVIASGHAKVR